MIEWFKNMVVILFCIVAIAINTYRVMVLMGLYLSLGRLSQAIRARLRQWFNSSKPPPPTTPTPDDAPSGQKRENPSSRVGVQDDGTGSITWCVKHGRIEGFNTCPICELEKTQQHFNRTNDAV